MSEHKKALMSKHEINLGGVILELESFDMEAICHGCFETVMITASADEQATDKIREWQNKGQLCDCCLKKRVHA